MNIFEAEDLYNPEDYFDCDIFELERDEQHVIYLEQPAYVLDELNIVCYEGFYCNIDNGEEMADFSLTAVFRNGSLEYWEQDGVSLTLHNYFYYTEEPVYLANVDCKIMKKEVSEHES